MKVYKCDNKKIEIVTPPSHVRDGLSGGTGLKVDLVRLWPQAVATAAGNTTVGQASKERV